MGGDNKVSQKTSERAQEKDRQEKDRLAAALRENLKRRKEQGRSQKSPNKTEITDTSDETN